ncbi:MAG: hypothetical protein ABSF10_20940 [Verrucomicrobiota bacterium]|jgi:hypothetical protein
MDDDSSLSVGYNEGGDDPPNDQPTDEYKNNQHNNFPTMNGDESGKPSWRVVAQEIINGTCVALIFEILGEDLFDKHGWPKVGDYFEFLAIVTLFVTASFVVLNYLKRPWIVWPICFVLCFGLGVFLTVSEFSEAKPKPHPDLKLILDAVDGNKVNVPLTNDFLFGSSNFMKPGKLLLVPIGSGASNVSLEFSVVNDSDVVVSDVELVLWSGPVLNCLKNAYWQPDTTDVDVPGKGWCAACPRSLYRNDRFPSGPLEFPSPLNTGWVQGRPYIVVMFVRANKEVKPVTLLSFDLMFSPSTNFSHTGIYRAINAEPTNEIVAAFFTTNKTFLWGNVFMVTNSN